MRHASRRTVRLTRAAGNAKTQSYAHTPPLAGTLWHWPERCDTLPTTRAVGIEGWTAPGSHIGKGPLCRPSAEGPIPTGEHDTTRHATSFGALLRQYRLEAGLTQAALAEEAELSTRGVQNLEAGLGQPYRATAHRLADALALTGEERARFEAAATPTPRRRLAAESLDVFLCHDAQDTPVVERLAARLKAAGLEPWFDEWRLAPGASRREEVLAGLRASTSCAVFVGPGSSGIWDAGELDLVLEHARRTRAFRLFLVLLPGVPEPFDATTLPPFLGTQAWVDLRSGTEQPGALGRLVSAIRGTPAGQELPIGLAEHLCPYRGLQPFDEEHAALFFGRDGDIQRLLEKLKAARFVAVVAPSGSGKSSLVRAGLLPALRRGALPGSETWLPVVLTPGAEPLTALATQLLRTSGDGPMQRTLDRLAADVRTLHLADSLALALHPPSARFVWVVDQFEEVFTQCRDKQRQAQFIANLLYAAAIPEGRSVVVLAMRADFYPHCAAYAELAARIAAQQLLLGPLDEGGLRQAIEEPVRRVGLVFEPGLVDTILDEVVGEPGSLPLLEHALLELWARRRGHLLTLEGYRSSGGVQRAIAYRADTVYSTFSPDEQAIARRILLRLTAPGDGTEVTRRRATLAELVTQESQREAIEHVVRALADARLLTTSGDPQSGVGWVEVAHEALIRSWPRLLRWIEEDRAALQVHRRLAEAAREWQRMECNNEGLYWGARLIEALAWRERNEAALNDLEREFLAASLALQERERTARERQRRGVMAALGVGLMAALLLSALVLLQWRQAEEQRQVAVARELAFQADAVRRGSAVLLPRSVLLAAETLKRFPSRDTEPILRQGLALLTRPIMSLPHEARVQAVTWSPDGRSLATASADGTARIWEAASGREVARLLHDGAVHAVAFSPDGAFLATASADGTARIWEVASGREVARLAHDDQVFGVAFGPAGQLLATASIDGSARVWEPMGGRTLAHMAQGAPIANRYSPDGGSQFAESMTQSVAFSPDGRYLATTRGTDGTARVWEAATGREVARLQHNGLVLAATFSPGGRYLATASVDGSARVWETTSGQEVARLAIERDAPVFAVAFSPDERYLAVGGYGSVTRVVEVPSGKEVASLWNDDTVQALSWSPDGRFLATASNDRTARVWEATSGREVARMPIDTAGVVYAVAFSPDGQYLATASDDQTVRLWEASKPWQSIGLAHEDSVIFVAYSPDGRYLATSSGTSARIWDAASGQELRQLIHPALAWAIHFSPDSRSLLTSSFDGTARVWDVASGQELARFQDGDNLRVWGARFSPDGRYVATADQAGYVRVWEVASGRQVMAVAHDAASGQPRFSPDGRFLVTGSVDRTARVWDLATGREVRRFTLDYPINDLDISPDGRYLAAGDDQTARVWRLDGGREVLHLPHDNAVNGVAFSPDGRYLATAARSGVARVWELASGRQVAGMAHDRPLNGVAFSPDGRYLATASNDHTVRLWVPVLEDPVGEACAHLTRNLTPQEWRQYLRNEPFRKTCPELP